MLAVVDIPMWRLGLATIPCLWILWWMFRNDWGGRRALVGIVRMVAQLLLVGYFLTYLFHYEHIAILLAVTAVMSVVSAWIASGSFLQRDWRTFVMALVAIASVGLVSLFWILILVLQIVPGTQMKTAIPLAGMIFSSSMNSVSVAGERFFSELRRSTDRAKAMELAFAASMIPVTNSLFAVGIVSIPGMMTGQILSGTDPTIAARYQIMVMLMLFGSAGTSAMIFLTAAMWRTKD